jgi:hypothetical protein
MQLASGDGLEQLDVEFELHQVAQHRRADTGRADATTAALNTVFDEHVEVSPAVSPAILRVVRGA